MRNLKQPQEPRIGRLKNGGVACDPRKLRRCSATSKTTGKRCGQPAMKGKMVCYIHGGKSPGAPRGNQYAFKHGLCTTKAREEAELIRDLIKRANQTLQDVRDTGSQ